MLKKIARKEHVKKQAHKRPAERCPYYLSGVACRHEARFNCNGCVIWNP